MQASQLQQMHVNNMNPMMFTTGESIQNSKMKQMGINQSYNQS